MGVRVGDRSKDGKERALAEVVWGRPGSCRKGGGRLNPCSVASAFCVWLVAVGRDRTAVALLRRAKWGGSLVALVAPVAAPRVRGGSVDGECSLGIVGVMVAGGFSDLFSAVSLLCTLLGAVGRSGWLPQGRRERKGGRCVGVGGWGEGVRKGVLCQCVGTG